MLVLESPHYGTTSNEHATVQVDISGSAQAGESNAHAFKLRPYQLEMLEESMRRNIIVAVWYSVQNKKTEAKDL